MLWMGTERAMLQLLGLVYKWKLGKKKPAQDAQEKAQALRDEEIIEL